MKIVYALKNIDNFMFSCMSNSIDELNTKLNRSYILWKGTRPRNSNHTIEDYLENKVKVKMTIETIE